jgi:hypothetical protein
MITGMGSVFVIYFSKDLMALDTLDFWVGEFLIVVLATLQVFLFSWVFGVGKGVRFANSGSEMKLPRLFPFVIRFITPAYLLVMLGTYCIVELPKKVKALSTNTVAAMGIALIASVTTGLLILIAIAGPRWKAESRDTSPKD